MIIHLNETDTLDVLVSDESYRYRTIMGEETISLTFNLPEHVEIPIGAYVEYQGETYTLNSPQNLRKNSTRNFEYTMILEAPKGALTKYRIKDTSNRLKFSLTAKPHEFLQLIVDNMNQRESGWIAGDYIESNEKVVTFSHNTCAEALQMVAEAFNTEYEISGKTIHLKKVEYNKESPLALSYGKGNGFLTGVRRENRDYRTRAIERLYVQGGSKNIDPSKYNNVSELLLPKSQTITTLDGRIYQTDAEGYSITRADKAITTNEEGSLDCSDIYPNLEGTVTEVITVDAAGNLYDIKDTTIPEGLDYTACLIEGEKMSLIFQTGMLAGKEFDVNYNHADRKFEIVWQDIDGQKMPNETFKPAVNDKYRVFNIHMPQAYISDNTTKTGASWDMFRKAVEYFSENEVPQFSFIGDLDPIWAKQNWLNIGSKIRLGGYVNFSDQQFQQDSALVRITGVKDYINRPYAPQIELSNAPVGVSISSYLGKIETTPVVIEQSKKDSINYTKRSYRDARETMEMLAAAISNYSGAINPITIQTMQALVGDESLQFRFVNGTTNPVVSNPTIEINTSKQLSISACNIQHMTLGITELKSQHADADYKFWNMPAYLSAPLTEPDKSYYLYAKASKSTATGEFILSETPIAMEQVAGFYHLLTLLIGKEYQGEREITTLWGFTEILPGRVTTDKIVSQDGKTYIDLVNNIIKGNISFKSGETYTDVGAGIAGAIATAAADATAKADAAIGEAQGYTDTVKAGLQAQIDGVVDSWFYAYSPTTSNYPASDWTTTELKQRHVGDTFTNTQPFVDNATTPDAGKSWRWVNNSGVFSWTQIADSDAVLALQRAAQAQDTADGKRRVFTTQPVTPYNVGDLWSQGTAGDLMKCKTERLTGSYNSADWEKASKYTDDTKANQAWDYADDVQNELNGLQVGGENIADRTEIAIVAGSENSRFDFIKGNLSSTPVSGSYLKNNQAHVLTISESIRTAGTATHYSVVLFDFTQLINTYQQEFAFSTSKRVIKFTTPATGNWSLLIYAGIAGATAGNSVEYKGIMLQEGNRETAYQSAVKYLTQAIEGSTEISGGLVATNIMLLKNALEQITGGLSGIDDDNIGFWTGGTYADALAGLAKIILRKDGSAHLVNAYLKGVIEATAGKIGGLNISGNSLVSDTMAFTETAVESLANLITPLTASMSSQASWSQSGTFIIEANTQNLAISFDSVLKFRASTTAGGISTSWELIIKNSSGETVYMNSGAGQLSPTLFSVNLPTGTYAIFLSSRGRKAQDSDPAPAVSATIQGESASPGVITAYGYQNRTKIGNNGFYSFWAAANYFYYSALHGLEYKGTMNIPGVLAAGSVGANGSHGNKWGAKVATSMQTITMQDTIIYVIPHNIGHTSYSAQATATEHSRVAYVYEKNTNNIKIAVRNLSGTNVLAQFDYLLIGNN